VNGRDRSGENNSPGRFVKIGNARIKKVKKNDRNTAGDCYYMKKSLVTFHSKYAWNKAIDFRIKTNHHLNYSFVHPYQPWIKNPLGVYERGEGHRRSFFRCPG